MVRNIHEKNLRQNFLSKQAIAKKILIPNISYMHIPGAHKRRKAAQRSIKLIVLTVVKFHNHNNTIYG